MSFRVESFVLLLLAGYRKCLWLNVCVAKPTGFPVAPHPLVLLVVAPCTCHWAALYSVSCQSEEPASPLLAFNELKWQRKLLYAEAEGRRRMSRAASRTHTRSWIVCVCMQCVCDACGACGAALFDWHFALKPSHWLWPNNRSIRLSTLSASSQHTQSSALINDYTCSTTNAILFNFARQAHNI